MLSVFIGTSLDGFIARPNSDLITSGRRRLCYGYNEFIASVDAIVIGRNTYEKVLTLVHGFTAEKRVVVLSSHPLIYLWLREASPSRWRERQLNS